MKIRSFVAVFGLTLALIEGTCVLAKAAPAGPKIGLKSTFVYSAYRSTISAFGINNAGVIVGSVRDGDDTSAFVRSANGLYHFLPLPPSDVPFLEAHAINLQCEIVGIYVETNDSFEWGFFNTGGASSGYLWPDCYGLCHTDLNGLNDEGDFAGWWSSDDTPPSGFAEIKGVPYDILVPGASNTYVTSISNSNLIGGYYNTDASNKAHGFVYDPATQTFTYFDYPGARNTFINGVNKAGWYVGTWDDAKGISHGFANVNNHWVTYNYPGTHTFTSINAINDSGLAAGNYLDFWGLSHGLVLQISP